MIEVKASGLYSTLQDLGRFGYRRFGVPVAGAMDQSAAIKANVAVGNPKEATVLEITAKGPVLEFKKDALISVSGAHFKPMMDGRPIQMNVPLEIPEGATLSFGSSKKGLRAYLAVQGGFDSELIMGSASTYLGITSESRLHKGDILKFHPASEELFRADGNSNKIETDFDASTLVVFRGPEFNALPQTVRNKLLNTQFKIDPRSSRMAYLLQHSEDLEAKEIVTAPVQPGTVQLTPGGQLIVLMRDAQTTGGYARVLQLSGRSIDLLAQKRAGDQVSFELN